MKKVIAITCMLVLLTCSMAAAQSFAIRVIAEEAGTAMYGGTPVILESRTGSQDGVDSRDNVGTIMDAPAYEGIWPMSVIPGSTSLFSRNSMSYAHPSTYPGQEKIWEIWVAQGHNRSSEIQIRVQTASSGVPGHLGPGEFFQLRWKNGAVLGTVTADDISASGGVDFLTVPIGKWGAQEGGQNYSGYADDAAKLEFVHAVPEPGSMLVLGTGLAGLVGFVSRRRRA